MRLEIRCKYEGVATGDWPATTEPFQGCVAFFWMTTVPGLPKLNPGLEFANTFGVVVSGVMRI